ncbi:Holliday junction resolvase RuvX [Lentiprolixibacter aurantiacus]|uniref:Putative pre-16S rRNA nuclease n=1 Tax=Lentiprolixibacter aurantiacus TaxID=2993939 RepID=A0AAE3SPP4_9FLAO|nr:Holliday junction resolvase RuvX [Lentiprolixibacter aurantiacus]MCX2720466.1 Holliday junction resolvase RuvX [Lentiprolixibacter aurantiacus]
MGRILALDYGKVRTGIAVTDTLNLIASGLTTVRTTELFDFLGEYLKKEEVETLVVGEPRQMQDKPSESEVHIAKFLAEFSKKYPEIKVARQDERFTSKLALRSMIEGGMKKKKRRDKALVDEISATLILQAYLERI